MKIIYQIRAWICRAFMHLELPIKIVAKFAALFLIFERVSVWEGFPSGLPFNSAAVHMILALLCVLLPMRFATFFAIVIILYNIYQVSFWGAIIAAVLLLVLYILISRLAPDETVLMILMPLLMKTNVLIVPLFAGAFMGVFSIIPIIGGIVLWGFMRILPVFLKFDVGAIDELPGLVTETISYIGDQFIKNKELLFLMILCAGIVVVVWLLNKVNFNYMRYLAVIAGAAVGFVCLVVGRTTGMIEISVVDTVKVPAFAMLAMIFVEFFHIALNYKMSRRLEFADDEYYYYVKAIPKILALSRKPEIKTITDGRTQMIPAVEGTRTDEAVKETVREAVREPAVPVVVKAEQPVPTERPAKKERPAKPAKVKAERPAKPARTVKAVKPVLEPETAEEKFLAEPVAEPFAEPVAEPATEPAAESAAEKVVPEPVIIEQAAAEPQEAPETEPEAETAEKEVKEKWTGPDLTGVKTFFTALCTKAKGGLDKAKEGFTSVKGFVAEKAAEIRKPKEEPDKAEDTENTEITDNADLADFAEAAENTAAAGEPEESVIPDLFADDLDDDEIFSAPEAVAEAAEPAQAAVAEAAEEAVTEAEEVLPERPQEQSLADLIPEDIRSGEKIETLKKETGWTDETIRLFFDGLDDEGK